MRFGTGLLQRRAIIQKNQSTPQQISPWNPISGFACLQPDSRAILYGAAGYSSEFARIFLYVGLE
jgi:hypothetical protein